RSWAPIIPRRERVIERRQRPALGRVGFQVSGGGAPVDGSCTLESVLERGSRRAARSSTAKNASVRPPRERVERLTWIARLASAALAPPAISASARRSRLRVSLAAAGIAEA